LNIQTKNNGRWAIVVGIFLTAFIFGTVGAQEISQNIKDALNEGDTTKAIGLIENEIESNPNNDINYYVLGQIYLKQGKLNQAEEQFQLSYERGGRYYPALYELSKVQIKLGKYKEADENIKYGLRKARKMAPEFHNAKGLLLMAQGKFNDADTEIRKAIAEDPDNAKFHINLGRANMEMGVYYTAVSEFEKAVGLDSASVPLDAYFGWAESCIELKDFSCALDKLSIVLKRDSSFSEAWFRAGGIYYKAARSNRNFDKAKEMYGKTIGAYQKYLELADVEPDSTNGRAFYESGMSYLILGGYEEAAQNFEKVLSIPVEPKDIYFYYGRAMQGQEKYDSALALYREHQDWVEEQGEDFESGVSEDDLFRRMGQCYEKQKDWFNTVNYYKKSLEIDSLQPRLLYGVAVAYNYLGDYRNALIFYKKRLDLGADERYWSIYYNAASAAMYLLEKGGGALVEEDEFDLDMEPADMEEEAPDELAGIDLTDLAIEYLEMITIEYWDKVSAKENTLSVGVKALNNLGSLYLFQKKDCANGVKNLERVLEHEPENCEALRSLGYAYFGGICPQNYNKAISFLEKALNCQVEQGKTRCEVSDLLLWIGQAYQFRAIEKSDQGNQEGSKADYKKAHDTYLEILKCDPGNQAAIEGEQQTKFMY